VTDEVGSGAAGNDGLARDVEEGLLSAGQRAGCKSEGEQRKANFVNGSHSGKRLPWEVKQIAEKGLFADEMLENRPAGAKAHPFISAVYGATKVVPLKQRIFSQAARLYICSTFTVRSEASHFQWKRNEMVDICLMGKL
jgi:hypothetical protein